MAEVTLRAGRGQWTPYGEQLIAKSMSEKGRAFIGAALLLRQQGGYEYPVLHLLCQGIEVLAKGYLLSVDYRAHQPKLKSYGHNLIKLTQTVEQVSKVRVLTSHVRAELEVLNNLYSQHLLRYGSGYDVLVDPTTIPSDRVLKRLAALLRMAGKNEASPKSAI